MFVFAGVLMLARGLQATLVVTGAPDNVIVLRRSATSELVSQIDRPTASILDAQPEVAAASDGQPLISKELMLVAGLYRKGTNALGNVSIRGVSPRGLELRPDVHITEGRPFQFGRTRSSSPATSRGGSKASRSVRTCRSPATAGRWSVYLRRVAPASIRKSGVTSTS